MSLPPDVQETLKEAKKIIREISCRHQEECRRECEPYFKIIENIRGFYPEPFLMNEAQAMIALSQIHGRKIITEPCPIGFMATREEYDEGDKTGTGKTEAEAIDDLKEQES